MTSFLNQPLQTIKRRLQAIEIRGSDSYWYHLGKHDGRNKADFDERWDATMQTYSYIQGLESPSAIVSALKALQFLLEIEAKKPYVDSKIYKRPDGEITLWQVARDPKIDAFFEDRVLPVVRQSIIDLTELGELTTVASEQITLPSTLPARQGRTPDEIARIVAEILAPLSGVNPTKEKILSDADFIRLTDYTIHFVTTGELPANIQIIERVNISVEHIRYTFYRLWKEKWSASRDMFGVFLHAVFSKFENQNADTTYRKFSESPKSYYTDLGLPDQKKK